MDWGLFLTFLAACMAAGATGAMFKPGAWYDNLTKPTWTPPSWVFPVTWTVLYVCMALSASWIAVMLGNAQAMAFWALQIALNTLWSPVFFGLRRMGAAMVVMIGLWLAVMLTMFAFFDHNVWAGLLFVPYAVWVTIAGALNFSVWRLNPEARA